MAVIYEYEYKPSRRERLRLWWWKNKGIIKGVAVAFFVGYCYGEVSCMRRTRAVLDDNGILYSADNKPIHIMFDDEYKMYGELFDAYCNDMSYEEYKKMVAEES